MVQKKLIIILLLGIAIRFLGLSHAPHFGDMDWYVNSAKTEILPLLGITTSITWLHQGPLWTYVLKVPVDPLIFTLLSGLLTIGIAYFLIGPLPAFILAVLPFAVTQDLTAYHTSPIPLLFFSVLLLINRRKAFLTGLFIGLLYQSHLLTFIYWPLWTYLLVKRQINLWSVAVGLVIGIMPFIISGPVQTLGIFAWIAKQIFSGFSGASSGVSTAYWIVFLPGVILAIGKVVKSIYAHWNSLGQK
jgi:hypothetical protein